MPEKIRYGRRIRNNYREKNSVNWGSVQQLIGGPVSSLNFNEHERTSSLMKRTERKLMSQMRRILKKSINIMLKKEFLKELPIKVSFKNIKIDLKNYSPV